MGEILNKNVIKWGIVWEIGIVIVDVNFLFFVV